jgi:hypothetical protein
VTVDLAINGRHCGSGALRAEIYEAASASLYGMESRPFPVPESGQIAVRAITLATKS